MTKKTNTKRRYFRLHSWLGLISGIFILFFAISGAIILFHKQLSASLNPREMTVQAPHYAERLPFDTLKKRILTAYPNYDFDGFPDLDLASPQKAMRVAIDRFDKYEFIYINPYTGEILGETKNKLSEWIYTFHYSFQLGRLGEWLAFLFGLSLMGSVITGYVVYKKHIWKVLTFQEKMRLKNWRQTSSSLHRILGVWALLFNFVLALSGVYMMLYLFVPSDEPMKKLPQNALVPIGISLDSCVKIAKTTFPDLQIHYIKTPRWEKDSTVSIWGNMPYSWQTGEYATAVDFNSLTGKLLQATHEKDLDVLTKTSLTLTTLHYGHYLGFFGELLYVILSIFTAVISITGFLLWWRRKV